MVCFPTYGGYHMFMAYINLTSRIYYYVRNNIIIPQKNKRL